MITPFGKVTVAVPGTATRATVNQSDPTRPVPVQSFMVQALPGNTGVTYVFACGGSFSDDRTNLTKCIGILPAPADPVDGPFPSLSVGKPMIPAGDDLTRIWIDVSVAGNGAVISAET